jgi:DNA-binding CsgD family transcriptional regulator
MPLFQTPITINEILSKAPGNPELWHLFLAELARTLQCDSGFLSIVELECDRRIHYLYPLNIAAEQHSYFEQSFRKMDGFDAHVVRHPSQVFCSSLWKASLHGNGRVTESDETYCRFGVSFPLNSHYAYCLCLNSQRSVAEPISPGCMPWLEALIPSLQNALNKEQGFNLYHQLTLRTGKHVAAYLIVDRGLKVLFSDAVFNRIIKDMECVKIREKRLAFINRSIEARVLALMDGDNCESVTLLNSCTPYDITVIPARVLDNFYAWEFYKKGIVLTFTSGHENNPTLIRLMALYNLTRSEALCALQFIATPSIPDIAAFNNRSPETVRNHLKSIMQKLDVHSQGALMKKLLAIAAL